MIFPGVGMRGNGAVVGNLLRKISLILDQAVLRNGFTASPCWKTPTAMHINKMEERRRIFLELNAAARKFQVTRQQFYIRDFYQLKIDNNFVISKVSRVLLDSEI